MAAFDTTPIQRTGLLAQVFSFISRVNLARLENAAYENTVRELNQLIKMHRQMADMMKKMGKMGKGGMLKQAMKGMFGKGGMPDMNDPKAMAEAAKAMQGKMPAGMPGLGGGMGLPPGLSGFGKKK